MADEIRQEIKDADWKLTRWQADPVEGNLFLTREVAFLSRDKAEAFKTSLVGTSSVASPHVEGRAWTGTFQVVDLEMVPTDGDAQDGDQTFVVRQHLITDGETAMTITVGVSCTETAVITYRFGISRAEIDSIKTDYATNEVGKIKNVQVFPGRNPGTYNFIGTVTTESSTAIVFTETTGAAFDVTSVTKYSFNLLKAAAETEAGLYSTPERGKTKTVRVSRNRNCLWDVVATINTRSATPDETDWTVYTDQTETTTFWLVSGLADEAAADAWLNTNGFSDSATAGVRKSAQVSQNTDGTFDIRASKTTAVADSHTFTYVPQGDGSVYTDIQINLADATALASWITAGGYNAATQGETYSISATANPDGTLNATAQKVTATARSSGPHTVFKSKQRTDTATIYRNQTSITAIAGSYGRLDGLRLNPDGTFDFYVIETSYQDDGVGEGGGQTFTTTIKLRDGVTVKNVWNRVAYRSTLSAAAAELDEASGTPGFTVREPADHYLSRGPVYMSGPKLWYVHAAFVEV